jgi:hypothetical protein
MLQSRTDLKSYLLNVTRRDTLLIPIVKRKRRPEQSLFLDDGRAFKSTNEFVLFFGNAVIGLRFESSYSGGPFP